MNHEGSACAGYAEDLSALLDAELPAEREALVQAHVESCPACTRRLAGLGRVDLALAAAPLPAVPANLRARLERRIAAEPAPSSPPPPRAHRRGPARRAPRARWLSPRALGLVAAAAAAAAGLALLLLTRPAPMVPPGAPAPETLARVPTPAPAPPSMAPAPERAATPLVAETAPPEPSDAELEELALVLELDTLEDLEVIANLDLLERLVALGQEASG